MSLDEHDASRHILLSNMANVFIEVGRLADSFMASAEALQLCRAPGDVFSEPELLRELSQYHCTVGDIGMALTSLLRGINIQKPVKPRRDPAFDIFLAQSFLRTDDPARALHFANLAWNGMDGKFERYEIWSAFLQGAAALALDKLGEADERLHHALVRARGSNVVEFELPILVALAELSRKRGDLAKARERLDEAWEAILEGPYVLVAADAYNVLAEIELAAGDRDAARQAAIGAYRAAWCDGPPSAYAAGLERARRHLAALGEPEPPMPPFDESRFAPWPDVEINPKDQFWVDPADLTIE